MSYGLAWEIRKGFTGTCLAGQHGFTEMGMDHGYELMDRAERPEERQSGGITFWPTMPYYKVPQVMASSMPYDTGEAAVNSCLIKTEETVPSMLARLLLLHS